MEGTLLVVPYSIAAFTNVLSSNRYANCVDIQRKWHIGFFDRYLSKLSVNTIVIEKDYVDHDYLEDYSNYYVKCFDDYERRCNRIHFFSSTFGADDFIGGLKNGDSDFIKLIKSTYKGFVVTKPLPKTVIGKTCIETYPEEGFRSFPIKRKYTANLFGIELELDTLAYQEQDSVAAACATSALWSVFQKTGILFHHAIPSPVEITKFATENLPAQSRNFPNHGLTLEQMAHAIRKVGLEPFYVGVSSDYNLKTITYAYLRMGLPVILAVDLVDMSKITRFENGAELPTGIGGHALAITGDCTEDKKPLPFGESGYLAIPTQINKFYVHDDQIGPFARMELDGCAGIEYFFQPGGFPKAGFSLSTTWKNENGDSSIRAVPQALLIPLYNKIRIPYESIDKKIIAFDSVLEIPEIKQHLDLPERLSWEIFLSEIQRFKTEILQTSHLSCASKEAALFHKMPRFIWRAVAHIGNTPSLEILFDATGVEQANLIIMALNCNDDLFRKIKEVAHIKGLQEFIRSINGGEPCIPILDWFKNN